MKFEWDEKKNSTNILKHSVSFSEVALIFADSGILSIFDEENSDLEDRWISLGRHPNGNLYVVVHTYRINNNREPLKIKEN